MKSWPSDPDRLYLARYSPQCSVLGPGLRAVIWVQGCPFRCSGCVAPETLPFFGGEIIATADLAQRLLCLPPEIQGLTFSGGEPFAQAAALTSLIQRLQGPRDWSFMSYTGYTLDLLRKQGSLEQQTLLKHLDLLIDGAYMQDQHADLLWRGSSNQEIHHLSPRFAQAEWTGQVATPATRMEFEFQVDGSLAWMGIPPRGFRRSFEAHMAASGLPLRSTMPQPPNRNQA